MIGVFFHVFPFWKLWPAAVSETMAAIEASGLSTAASFVRVCVVKARQYDRVDLSPWPWATRQAVGHHNFEWDTIKVLWDWCRSLPEDDNSLVLYLHTKGVTSRRWDCAADWRRYMTYFMVERWQETIKVFDDPLIYAAGCTLKDKPPRKGIRHALVKQGRSWRDLWHYPGNFWWARAGAIRGLADPASDEAYNIITWKGVKKRLAAERWIGGVGRNHMYNLHKAQVDLNSQRYPRKLYAGPDQAV